MYWKQLSMKIYFVNPQHLAASLNKVPYMQNTLADCWQNAGQSNDTGSGSVCITPKYLHWTVMTQRGSLLLKHECHWAGCYCGQTVDVQRVALASNLGRDPNHPQCGSSWYSSATTPRYMTSFYLE
jgi:hypothetical protein